mmetsp:Transcript_33536/g.88982  ORF Transcript_33536/g.88982 Transcript_33536/m.88982 type:complete len:242 (-) Transcript_33536:1359-2084(-)
MESSARNHSVPVRRAVASQSSRSRRSTRSSWLCRLVKTRSSCFARMSGTRLGSWRSKHQSMPRSSAGAPWIWRVKCVWHSCLSGRRRRPSRLGEPAVAERLGGSGCDGAEARSSSSMISANAGSPFFKMSLPSLRSCRTRRRALSSPNRLSTAQPAVEVDCDTRASSEPSVKSVLARRVREAACSTASSDNREARVDILLLTGSKLPCLPKGSAPPAFARFCCWWTLEPDVHLLTPASQTQ